MKTLGKIILTILFILFFLIFSIFLTVKFQLLDSNFWKDTFSRNNVYSGLSTVIKNNLESQVVAGGGKQSDTATLTDLVTPGNVKDTIENNIDNILGFVNGGKKEIFVYLPIDKIPMEFLPVTNNKISRETKLQDLLTEFNVVGVTVSQINQIKIIGMATNVILTLSIIIILVILFSLHFSGIALVLGGMLVAASAGVIKFLSSLLVQNVSQTQSLSTKILEIVFPPILLAISKFLTIEATIIIVIGVILFIIKKIK